MKVWGFFKGEGTLPSAAVVKRALEDVGSGKVRLDRAARTVRFLQPGVELDPGGIGKGYAIDRMVAILKRRGVTSAFLSAGGSSLYGLGVPPDEPRGWTANIRNPRATGRTIASVFLQDMSLSTSGSYEKFFRASGHVALARHGPAHWISRHRHIIRVGHCAADDRQRSLDQGVLHQWPGLGRTSPPRGHARVHVR